MKPTIRDVAKKAEVSISTVSRVMNAPNTVAEEKRMRVLAAISALHYQPNAFARGLVQKKSNTLAMLIPDIRNPYYGEVTRGMEDASNKYGYNLIICNSDRNESRLHSYFESFIEKQVDGVLCTCDVIIGEEYEMFSTYRLPLVFVSVHANTEYPTIVIDEEQAAYDGVKHLIDLGHQNIGFICFPLKESHTGRLRYRGFVRALMEHKLEHCIANVEYAKHWFEDAYVATSHLFQKHPEITGVFTTSDQFAFGTISYLHENGLHTPEKVSVIGFDNTRMSKMVIPKLTTVGQPSYEMGYKAVEKLHELITCGKVTVMKEVLKHEIVLRDSTRRISHTKENNLS